MKFALFQKFFTVFEVYSDSSSSRGTKVFPTRPKDCLKAGDPADESREVCCRQTELECLTAKENRKFNVCFLFELRFASWMGGCSWVM
jgi:hypothetical protein